MKKLITLCFIIVAVSVSSLGKAHAQNNDMKNFLLACAYGTAGGAAVGLLSVALSDDPDSKLDRVAKGASLGLYAGIGFGLYLIYGEAQTSSQDDYGMKTIEPKDLSPVWMSLDTHEGKVSGAKVDWVVSNF